MLKCLGGGVELVVMNKKILITILLVILSFSASHKTFAANYNLVVDDNFQRANTSVGVGANSTTGLGNGWVDFVGNIYNINNQNLVSTQGESSPALDGFYYSATGTDDFQNGKVVAYSRGTGLGTGVIGRFNPNNGGSGYSALLWSAQTIFLYKAMNGVQQTLLSVPVIMGTIPITNPVIEMSITDIDNMHTEITVNIYNASNTNAVICTYSYIDNSSPLQASGYWGGSEYGTISMNRIQIYSLPAGVMTPPLIGINYAGNIINYQYYGPVQKTYANLFASAVAGGVSPITYQWQKSLTSSSEGFENISNATTTILADTGLTPGTDYYYRLQATDSSTTPQIVISNVIHITPVLNTNPEHVIGYIGDSITSGQGSSEPGALVEYLTLQADGYLVGYNNQGEPGARISQWQPGGTYFNNALSSFESTGVDTVSIMLGTNDAGDGTSSSTYETEMQNIISALLTQGTGINRVILNYSPYETNNSVYVESSAQIDQSLLTYQNVLKQIALSTSGVNIGDTSFYNQVQENQSLLSDGIHPTQAGYNLMGADWTEAYISDFGNPTAVAANPSLNSATINWITEASSSSQVNYGLASNYTSTTTITDNMGGVMDHSVTISGLNSCTTYHYQVISTDQGGNVSTSTDSTFTTTCPTPSNSVTALSTSNSSGGGSVSTAVLATLLAPSASTTAYLASLNMPKNTILIQQSFIHDLYPGTISPDVKNLQAYLNTHDYPVSTKGPGSLGHETTFFGPATKAALRTFQIAHHITGTGNLGPLTRKLILQ